MKGSSMSDMSGADLSLAGKKQPEQAQIKKPRLINVRTIIKAALQKKKVKPIG